MKDFFEWLDSDKIACILIAICFCVICVSVTQCTEKEKVSNTLNSLYILCLQSEAKSEKDKRCESNLLSLSRSLSGEKGSKKGSKR